MKSEYFKSVVSYINSRGFINETVSCSHRQVNQCNRNLESALKAQLVSSSENIDLPTPPSTPMQPKRRSPPNCKLPPNSESPRAPNHSPSDSAKPKKEEGRSGPLSTQQKKKNQGGSNSSYEKHQPSVRRKQGNAGICAWRMLSLSGRRWPCRSRECSVSVSFNGRRKGRPKSIRQTITGGSLEQESPVHEGSRLDLPPF